MLTWRIGLLRAAVVPGMCKVRTPRHKRVLTLAVSYMRSVYAHTYSAHAHPRLRCTCMATHTALRTLTPNPLPSREGNILAWMSERRNVCEPTEVRYLLDHTLVTYHTTFMTPPLLEDKVEPVPTIDSRRAAQHQNAPINK